MRRLLVALATTTVAAALFVPAASARVHITLRYTAVLDLKIVLVSVELLRDTDVLDEKSAHMNPGSEAISFGALLYVPRGIAGSARFYVRNGRGESVVLRARLRFREGTVSARAVIGRRSRERRLRVTGGTRRFRGARGDLRFVGARGRGDRIGLVLRLR